MTDIVAFTINGESLLAHASGALFHPTTGTLVVSDLHFEKGSFFASHGTMLPPYDTRETLRRLEALFVRFEPRTVLSLGDAFHDGAAEGRMADDDAGALARLTARAAFVFILGNHDPAPPARFRGKSAADWRIGGLVFRHQPETFEPGEIAGHFHPVARVRTSGRSVRRRCFVKAGDRLVLPAFGAYAGGLDVLDPEFPYSSQPFDVLLTDGEELFAFPSRTLVASPAPSRAMPRASQNM